MDQINNNNEIKVKLRTTNCDDLAALKAENMGRKCGFKLIPQRQVLSFFDSHPASIAICALPAGCAFLLTNSTHR